MVADFVSRTWPGPARSTVRVLRTVHHAGDYLTELKRGSARCVFLVSVVALEYLHVDARRKISECFACNFRQLHRNIDGRAHVWRPNDRNSLGSLAKILLLIAVQARC